MVVISLNCIFSVKSVLCLHIFKFIWFNKERFTSGTVNTCHHWQIHYRYMYTCIATGPYLYAFLIFLMSISSRFIRGILCFFVVFFFGVNFIKAWINPDFFLLISAIQSSQTYVRPFLFNSETDIVKIVPGSIKFKIRLAAKSSGCSGSNASKRNFRCFFAAKQSNSTNLISSVSTFEPNSSESMTFKQS